MPAAERVLVGGMANEELFFGEEGTTNGAQSERLYGETKAVLAGLMPLTEHLVGRQLDVNEMSLGEALLEIRKFESG